MNSSRPSGGVLTGIGSSPIRILLALLLSFSQACASSASAAAEVKCGGVGRSCNTKCKRKTQCSLTVLGVFVLLRTYCYVLFFFAHGLELVLNRFTRKASSCLEAWNKSFLSGIQKNEDLLRELGENVALNWAGVELQGESEECILHGGQVTKHTGVGTHTNFETQISPKVQNRVYVTSHEELMLSYVILKTWLKMMRNTLLYKFDHRIRITRLNILRHKW